MKTTKFFSVLSLALIFVAANSVYAGSKPTNDLRQEFKPSIRYEVTVHFSLGVSMCNTYWVRVTYENGRLVAPPKIFAPGISKYVFIESVSTPGKARVASLVLSPDTDPYACPNNLITKPDVRRGSFKAVNTYSFDLFPLLQRGVIKE
jgi:hypothetical protein